MHDNDDVDDLFQRTPPPPPPRDIGARARERLRVIAGARRLTVLALLAITGLVTLAGLAFMLGASIAASETPALVRLALEDRALAIQARDELARALIAAVPWPYVVAATVNALGLFVLMGALLRATAQVVEGAPLHR
jgi:predicted anti-sigma-YlaC factor YlaD